jgi:hypothetical protein
MAKHVSYRGITIDMEAMRRENEKVPAIGNMKVNARGDKIDRGQITKTAEEIARENHRIKTAVVSSGLKGPIPKEDAKLIENKKPVQKQTKKDTKEVELPNGDIVYDDKEE